MAPRADPCTRQAAPPGADAPGHSAGPRATERRRLLASGACLLLLPQTSPAQSLQLDAGLRERIRLWAGAAVPREGRVRFDIAPLVDNGNVVPITVTVDSPMTEADHVREIIVFTERNPQHDVVHCQLGPENGRAQVATRIRLATSQHLVALARLSDGSVWQHTVEVIVTLAACIET